MRSPVATTVPHCCNPECGKAAEFGIYGAAGHPEDCTEACEDHVGALLGTPMWLPRTNTHWIIYPIEAAALAAPNQEV